MKFFQFFLFCLLYVLVLFSVYIAHINLFSVNVVFYASLLDALIAAVVTYVISFFIFRKYSRFNWFESFTVFCIWILGGYAFAITGPTVLDRSLSFYIIEKIDLRGGMIEVNEIEEIFLEYIPEVRLVDVRLTEQLESGTLVWRGNCLKLTEKGSRLVEFSRFARQNLLAKKRLLAGEYTDELTKPATQSNTNRSRNC